MLASDAIAFSHVGKLLLISAYRHSKSVAELAVIEEGAQQPALDKMDYRTLRSYRKGV